MDLSKNSIPGGLNSLWSKAIAGGIIGAVGTYISILVAISNSPYSASIATIVAINPVTLGTGASLGMIFFPSSKKDTSENE